MLVSNVCSFENFAILLNMKFGRLLIMFMVTIDHYENKWSDIDH